MSKRSIKKYRHLKGVSTSFKEKVNRGKVAKLLAAGDITYSQVPYPMRDTLGNDVPDLEVNEFPVEEHIHGENCSHGK